MKNEKYLNGTLYLHGSACFFVSSQLRGDPSDNKPISKLKKLFDLGHT
jgi:hypothetical protein